MKNCCCTREYENNPHLTSSSLCLSDCTYVKYTQQYIKHFTRYVHEHDDRFKQPGKGNSISSFHKTQQRQERFSALSRTKVPFWKSHHVIKPLEPARSINSLFYSILLTREEPKRLHHNMEFFYIHLYISHKMFICFCDNSVEHFYFGKRSLEDTCFHFCVFT